MQMAANSKREWNCERNDDGTAHISQEQDENDGYKDHAGSQIVLDGFNCELHQVRPVEKRNNFHAFRKNAVIQLVYLLVDPLQHWVRIVSFLQQHNPFYRVGVIDNRAIRLMRQRAQPGRA